MITGVVTGRRVRWLTRPGAAVALSLAILTSAVPAGATGAAVDPAAESVPDSKPRRVLVISLPGVGWRDIDAARMPNLAGLFRVSALANLSTRAPTLRTDLTGGYTTFGSGDKAVGPRTLDSGEGLGVEEAFGVGTAGESFRRRTGESVSSGIVHLGIASIRAANANSRWEADVGVLGGALAEGEFTSSVIANADLDEAELVDRLPTSPYHREAVAALMNPSGIVDTGRVDTGLLHSDPAAPFGVRLAPQAVRGAFSEVWLDDSVVLVEGSDIVRADAYAPGQTAEARVRFRNDALAWTDHLVGLLLAEVDLERDSVLVMGPAPAPGDNRALTVVSLHAPGVTGGYLRSPTTQRPGYVQLMDLAPTVLELVGLDRPDSMRGRAVMQSGAGTLAQRRGELVDADRAARFRAEIREPLTLGFVAIELLLAAGAVIVAARGVRGARPWLAVAARATLGVVVAVYLARLVAFHDMATGVYFVATIGLGAFAGWAAGLIGRRDAVDPIIAMLGAIVGVLSIDVLTGANLQLSGGFGSSPEIGGRFIGFGNIAYAFLAAAAVLLAGLVAHRVGARRGAMVGTAVLIGAIVVDGAPMWGADVGGVLTMVPAYAVTAALLFGREIRTRAIAVFAGLTATTIAVLAAADWLRPAAQRTHLGRLVEQVRVEGGDAFIMVARRKLEMNLSTLSSSQWRPLVVVGLAFVAYLAFGRAGRLRHLLEVIPPLRASLVGLATVAVLGYALNDQGIVIPAVMLAVLIPVLVALTASRLVDDSRLDERGDLVGAEPEVVGENAGGVASHRG